MRFLEVVNDRPPNYPDIVAVFPGAAGPGVMFAYGGRIYAPGHTHVPPALQAHEIVHVDRQAGDSDGWWGKYLSDRDFRFEEELLAHREEYRAYCARHANPRKRREALEVVARKLAAPLYGGLVGVDDARRLLAG